MTMGIRPYGDETACGWQTDAEEVCGEESYAEVAATFKIAKPLSDLQITSTVHDFVCYKHHTWVLATAAHVMNQRYIRTAKAATERG